VEGGRGGPTGELWNEAPDRVAAEKFNRADPFHQNGVWGKVEIRRFDRKE
jgi:uncharacterized protein YciI